ncbi:MAG TPA: hypothetical protein EYN91_10680 [Candidatus Melainabacteria bacterium]|nr:hypothetical protein [Candidatus Obscuribacterales bacterium]HIA52538.1 hypothetical protein [Candidatus Melainabacteria bacterium]HIN64074.1 hypothetical protein [Candidatus Obscuribacterales bacterium]
MRITKQLVLSISTVFALSACSNADQKSDQASQPTTGSTANTTSTETSESTSAGPQAQSKAGEVYEGTIKGVISDSMCGKDHSKMGAEGADPKACIDKCISSGAKYILVDEKGDSYALSDQEKPKELAGAKVAITGHIDPTDKSIHVHSIVSQ